MTTEFVVGETVSGLAAELLMFGRPVAFMLHDDDPRGATTEALARRVHYGGRKGRAAFRRLRAIYRLYESETRRLQRGGYVVTSVDSGARLEFVGGETGHRRNCPVDMALHAAGFRDEASRKAAGDFIERSGP